MNKKDNRSYISKEQWESLFEEFPNVYSNGIRCGMPCVGFGWLSILYDISVAIDNFIKENPCNFQVDQIKEKFASMRFYFSTTLSNAKNDILFHIVEDIADRAYYTCENCGNAGKKRSNGFWMKTYCEDCANKLGYGGHNEQDGEDRENDG